MKTKYIIYIILVLILTVSSIFFLDNSLSKTSSEDKFSVYTSFYPLKFLAKSIAGDTVDIKMVIPHGAEVHSFEPSPKIVAKLERADLFIYNGAGLEPWGDKVSSNLKESGVRVIKVSEWLDLLPLHGVDGINNEVEKEEDHRQEDHHHHEYEYDPHFWLDPYRMKEIAGVIKEALIELDRNHEDVYKKNYEKLVSQLDKLDAEYQQTLSNTSREYILVSHAAFGYLAHRYGFKQLAVTGIAPHEEPSPAVMARLTKKAEKYNLNYVYLETLASPKTVSVLAAESNLKILSLTTIASLTEEEYKNGENYFSLMRKNLRNLKKELVK